MINSRRMQGVWMLLFSLLALVQAAGAETFTEQASQFLTAPTVAGALLTLGIVFWFMSVITLGTGVAEVACFTCFTLLFGGRYLEGQEVWVPLGLFLAGAIFAAIEVFVIPGLGVFGVLSMVSFAGLSVLLMESPQAGLGIFSLSILLSILGGYLVFKFLPRFFVIRKNFVLEPPAPQTPAQKSLNIPLVQPGDVGEALSTLRPVGTVLFGTERVEVLSEGEFLKKGQAVEVVRVEGQKVVVRSCQI